MLHYATMQVNKPTDRDDIRWKLTCYVQNYVFFWYHNHISPKKTWILRCMLSWNKITHRYIQFRAYRHPHLIYCCTSAVRGKQRTLAMTSGSGSSMGSAHSTVTTFPQTFTLPLINLRRAWAAVLWSSYSKKQKPRFFFLSSGWWYKMTSFKPSVEIEDRKLFQENWRLFWHKYITLDSSVNQLIKKTLTNSMQTCSSFEI